MSGDYVRKRVAALRDHSQEIYEQAEEVSNDFSSWTALKLILHSAAVNMYTKVHRSQGTGDTFYIDALAGSGVSMYDSDRYFIGSPLLAARSAKMPFTKMYFIESNEDRCDALSQRLEYAFTTLDYTEPKEYEVIQGNVNDEIGPVVNEIQSIGNYNDFYNYYCFIDNQGLDVEWSSIKQLTPEPYGDLLINIPTAHALGRNVGTDAAARFFGVDSADLPRENPSRTELLDRYLDQLKSQGREIQTSTQVQTNVGSFYYDLAYVTRETGGNNGYMEVIDYVKRFIESVDSGDVDQILDPEQSAIDEFLPDDSIEDQLMNEDEDQTGLDEFS